MMSATCRNIKGIAEARVRYHIIRWNLFCSSASPHTSRTYLYGISLMPMLEHAFKRWQVDTIFTHDIHRSRIRKIFRNGIVKFDCIGILVIWIVFGDKGLEERQLVRICSLEHADFPLNILPTYLFNTLNRADLLSHGPLPCA